MAPTPPPHLYYSLGSRESTNTVQPSILPTTTTAMPTSKWSANLTAAELLLTSRFRIVILLGSSLALFGIVANALLAKLFLSRLNFRLSPFFFLGFVALFDFLLDTVYIILLTPPVLAEYYEWDRLYLYWLPRARWLYRLGQVFKTSSCFCLIVASFERYMMTRHWTFSGFEAKRRWIFLVVAIVLASLLRVLTASELHIHFNPHQHRVFQRYILGQTSTTGRRSDDGIWGFLQLLTVIIPFGTLIFLNGGIVLMLRHQNIQQLRSLITELTMGHDMMKVRRRNLKAATNTLLVIITAYLFANLPNLFLSVAQYLYPDYLQRRYPIHYILGSDIASVLTVVGNALRFPAHFLSNKEIRDHFRLMLCPGAGGNRIAGEKAGRAEEVPLDAHGGSRRSSIHNSFKYRRQSKGSLFGSIRRAALSKKNSAATQPEISTTPIVTYSLCTRRLSAYPDNPWFAVLLATPRIIASNPTSPSSIVTEPSEQQFLLPTLNGEAISGSGRGEEREREESGKNALAKKLPNFLQVRPACPARKPVVVVRSSPATVTASAQPLQSEQPPPRPTSEKPPDSSRLSDPALLIHLHVANGVAIPNSGSNHVCIGHQVARTLAVPAMVNGDCGHRKGSGTGLLTICRKLSDDYAYVDETARDGGQTLAAKQPLLLR